MAGSNATFDEAWTQFGLVTKILNSLELVANSNTPNVLDMIDALTTGTDGEFTPRALSVVASAVRNPFNGMLSPQVVQAALRPALHEMGRVIGVPTRNGRMPGDKELLRRIRQHMVDNTLHIKASGQTLNTSFTTAGTGNGDWVRMNVSKDGDPFTVGADAVTFECISDQLSGSKEHAEVWECRGTDAGDNLQLGGVGVLGNLTTLNARSSNLIQNGSFDTGGVDNTALTSTTQLTGWTVTTAANWKPHSSTAAAVYRGAPGVTTPFGVENTASDAISQVIKTTRPGSNFPAEIPHVAWCRWKRLNSATGTLTLTLGSQTAAATIGSASNDAWNTLLLPASTTDTKAYYDTWKLQDATFGLATSTLATGTIYIDDAGLAPMQLLGNTYYAYLGGSTPALRGATSAISDSDGTRGINGYWLWRGWGQDGQMPTNATPSQADPS